jgi:glycylpeptide N-tetradecanoyltransferase
LFFLGRVPFDTLGEDSISFLNEFQRMSDQNKREFKFWKTQPVPQFGELFTLYSSTSDFSEDADPQENTYIEAPIEVNRVRQEPYAVLKEFEWSDINIQDEGQLNELYRLLSENYVEDDENMFRFDYSKDFLKW